MLSVDDPDPYKVGIKLHKQFGHPTAGKLIKLLHNAGVHNKKLESELNKISDSCEICLKFRKPIPRPVVALPIADKFNDLVAMDLKSYDGVYFLVLVDHATRYCASVVISNKKPCTIVQGLFLMWISLFGPPSKFFFDNGGEFNNAEMRQLADSFNIKLMTTSAESPWSNGIVEKMNSVLANSVRRIMADSKCDVRTALAWAVSARNSLDNYTGYSPSQLVFGFNTVLPNVFQNKPPALEDVHSSDMVRQNLNAMHAARMQFVKVESCEKIRRALRHNVRESPAERVQNGDNVYYKRNDSHEWRGPGVVIGRDGKQFIVKHGGLFVRVHVCRLAAIEHSENTSDNANFKIFPENRNALSSSTIVEDSDSCDEDNSLSRPDIGSSDHNLPNDADSASDDNDSSTDDSPFEDCNSTDEMPPTSDQSSAQNIGSQHVIPLNPGGVKVGQRIQAIDKSSGELLTGKVIGRAGKATASSKHCYNIRKDDDNIVWYDVNKDLDQLSLVPDDVELLIFMNNDMVTAAKNRELENWKENNVYEEVENTGQATMSVRWVVTEKIKNNESVFKARLVARGFEEDSSELQKDAPTCLKESVKIALAIASTKGWKLHSLDIKSAYLQGNVITRDVYLRPPPEYNNGLIWKLNKTVYGLCDAARSWYLRVKEQLLDLGLHMCSYDNAVFSYIIDGKLEGIICLYVDDFLYCGTEKFKRDIVSKINNYFTVGNEECDVFKYIGLNIMSKAGKFNTLLDQIQYCCSLKPMPLSRGRLNNRLAELSPSEKTEFRSLIGQLNWVATQTRPDIAFDVCELSGLVKNATVADVLKLNKVVARLTTDCFKISIPKLESISNCVLECYSDSSYANLPGGGSQGGFIIFLKDTKGMRCPLYWQSRRIRRVVKSTLAAETLALLDGAEAAYFIGQLISNIANVPVPKVFCKVDNLSLVNAVTSSKLVDDRRLRVDIAVLQDMIDRRELHAVTWVNSESQLADSLTKKGVNTTRLREAISF